jgi:geranylgeranyl diphosphate synthase, type II
VAPETLRRAGRTGATSGLDVDAELARYRDLVVATLLADLPPATVGGLYGLVPSYPSRPSKGLRPALCLATCVALGGEESVALNSAVAIELFHNAFLIHDDIQDESELRRGSSTLVAEHGVEVALNVGNATNLLGLQRLMANRPILGSALSWEIMQETERMLGKSLEGQARELEWIRDNACDLAADDYYRMCLLKTSWYTCIYPCRVGALIAGRPTADTELIDRFGWYLGAAFQITDDVLNLSVDSPRYGKEVDGDLWEGKRTLMLIDFLQLTRGRERQRVHRFLAQRRQDRTPGDVAWLHERLVETGCVQRARADAAQLAEASYDAGLAAFADAPQSAARDFLLALPGYMIGRDR